MGKVKDTGGEETSAFTELFQRINNHFSNEQMVSTVPHPVLSVSKMFESIIVIIFLSISLNMCFGCSKEPSH